MYLPFGHKIKTLSAVLLLAMAGQGAFAQVSFSRQVIGSAGAYNEFGGISLSSTTGEAVTTSLFSNAIDLTQGFQQPFVRVPELGLVIFTGITPNNDGTNETWVIEGIEEYPDNRVYIFNRWGSPVWEASGYDNVNVVWAGTNRLGYRLPDATYYYVIELALPTGTQAYKGWVQLNR